MVVHQVENLARCPTSRFTCKKKRPHHHADDEASEFQIRCRVTSAFSACVKRWGGCIHRRSGPFFHPTPCGGRRAQVGGTNAATQSWSSHQVFGMGAEGPLSSSGRGFLCEVSWRLDRPIRQRACTDVAEVGRFRQDDGPVLLDGVLIRRNRSVSSKRSLLEKRTKRNISNCTSTAILRHRRRLDHRYRPRCCGLFASDPRR